MSQELKSTSFVEQWDLLVGYRAAEARLGKTAPVSLTQWEIGDATNCDDGTAEEESGLENVKQSSCFGHVKGKHPRGDWVGTWINELAGDRRGWLEIQS